MIRLGCYHAHHSNIEHVEKALADYQAELVHFVDPGLDRIKNDADFHNETMELKVKETLDWIAGCHVDAILITCTFFTAVYEESLHPLPVPVIKIDDPLFQALGRIQEPILWVFTNPDTVQGTMEQFRQFCRKSGHVDKSEWRVLAHTFSLIMQGKKEAYTSQVTAGLCRLAADHPEAVLVAPQLSMAPAAQQAGKQSGAVILNPLYLLGEYLVQRLSLQRK